MNSLPRYFWCHCAIGLLFDIIVSTKQGSVLVDGTLFIKVVPQGYSCVPFTHRTTNISHQILKNKRAFSSDEHTRATPTAQHD